jgi:hypothetical protein
MSGAKRPFLGVWLLGGLMTLIGALCYAELAAAHPSAGGEYHFLFRAYGRSVATLFAWARGTGRADRRHRGGRLRVRRLRGAAPAARPLRDGDPRRARVALLSGLNLVGTTQSARAQVLFTDLDGRDPCWS